MRYPTVLVLAALTLAGSLPSSTLFAAQHGRPATGGAGRGDVQRDRLHDQDRLYDRDRLRDRDTIYGSQLMTPAERSAYRTKMRSLKTEQERQTLRTQHHEEMQKRAQERGVKLPDSPPGQGARGGMGQAPATQPVREQTEQETRERTQQGTPSSSGQGAPTREQTEQEQRERSSTDQSDGH